MKPPRSPFLSQFLPILAALASIGLTRLILSPVEGLLSIQVIVLLYLLPVMISTVLWGFLPGVTAALAAFVTFNYFYIEPFHTLEVHQTQDLITLIVFLIVAGVMSQLIDRERRGLHLARSREWEAQQLYGLLAELSRLADMDSIAQCLADHTQQTFQFQQVEVQIDRGKPNGAQTTASAGPAAGSLAPNATLPLQTGRGSEGELRIWHQKPLSPAETSLLEAFARQGGLALERVRLDQAESKTRLLEESDQMKTSLLNSVSHELRSPLAAIKASVSSLRSGAVPPSTPAAHELLATIEEETDHLNFLVGNLLDMSRIESGALQPHLRWNAIGEIAAGVVARMRKQMMNHELELSFSDDLPLVPTDYVLIEQVFTNLISNSIKYAPGGTVISLSAARDGSQLHVQVANQGPPVRGEDLERIFDKFYRVTAADRITGTGLGLSICKGIIAAHGGRIWAENQPGRFVFHFVLPLTLDGSLPQIPKEAADG